MPSSWGTTVGDGGDGCGDGGTDEWRGGEALERARALVCRAWRMEHIFRTNERGVLYRSGRRHAIGGRAALRSHPPPRSDRPRKIFYTRTAAESRSGARRTLIPCFPPTMGPPSPPLPTPQRQSLPAAADAAPPLRSRIPGGGTHGVFVDRGAHVTEPRDHSKRITRCTRLPFDSTTRRRSYNLLYARRRDIEYNIPNLDFIFVKFFIFVIIYAR